MTFLWFLAGLFILIFLLLLIPVSLRFCCEGGEAHAELRYLLFRYDFSPEKAVKRAEKNAARAIKKEERKQKKEEEAKPKGLNATVDTVKTIWSLIRDSGWGLKLIRRNIVLYGVKILISAGGEDAHQAAEKYGRLCAVVFPTLGIVDRLVILREPSVYIAPNFTGAETVFEISFRMRATPMIILIAAVDITVKFARAMLANKKKRKIVKKKRPKKAARI